MHTVIKDECIGCELCIASCPVNCIEMTTVEHSNVDETITTTILEYKKNQVGHRIYSRLARLEKNAIKKQISIDTPQARKAANQAAILRVQAKKLLQKCRIK